MERTTSRPTRRTPILTELSTASASRPGPFGFFEGRVDLLLANQAQSSFARMIASERAPTSMRLTAQVASRLNQLRDTNLRPR
jgi:hypothetical protein